MKKYKISIRNDGWITYSQPYKDHCEVSAAVPSDREIEKAIEDLFELLGAKHDEHFFKEEVR